MLGKIITGKGFKGTLQYIFGGGQLEDDHRAHLITTNLAGSTPEEMAREFAKLKDLNKRVGKPVKHIPISFAKGETPTDEHMELIAKEYLKEMGFKNCPFVVVKHTDTVDHKNGCSHFHLVTSRINFQGKTINDKYEQFKSIDVLEKLSIKYGYKPVSRKKYNKKESQEMNQNNFKISGKKSNNNYTTQEYKKNSKLKHPQTYIFERIYKLYNKDLQENEALQNVVFLREGITSKDFTTSKNDVISDFGDNIKLQKGKPSEENIRIMLELTKAKNWEELELTGDKEFLSIAYKEATKMGLKIKPIDKEQEKLFAKFDIENNKDTTSINPVIVGQNIYDSIINLKNNVNKEVSESLNVDPEPVQLHRRRGPRI